MGSWPCSHVCTSGLTSSCDLNRLAWRCFFFMLGKGWKSEGARSGLQGRCSRISQSHCSIVLLVSTHTVQYPLRKCVVHENCGAWAMKVLPSSGQCLNFKWIKSHLTMWSYLVAKNREPYFLTSPRKLYEITWTFHGGSCFKSFRYVNKFMELKLFCEM